MQRITILQAPPDSFSGVSAKTGKPYTLVKQAALLTHENGKVEAFTWMGDRVDGKNVPTAPGTYTLGASGVVREGSLILAPVLVPVGPASGGAK